MYPSVLPVAMAFLDAVIMGRCRPDKNKVTSDCKIFAAGKTEISPSFLGVD
jgi:hypothetical protein